MLNVVLIRTGTSEYESQGRIQGILDVPLCASGRQQVSNAAEQMSQAGVELSVLYVGPCRCAQQTAEVLQQRLHVKTKTLPALRNLDQGLWQGLLIDDVRKKQPKVYRQWQDQPETVCPPQGETLADARARLAEALVKLRRKHKLGTIGLVAPEPLASVLVSQLKDAELTSLWLTVGVRDARPLWESIPWAPGN